MAVVNGPGLGGELYQSLCPSGLRSGIEDRGRDPRFRADGKEVKGKKE